MNIFDKHNKFVMSIDLHTKYIIVNLGSGNDLYEFEKYNQVLMIVVEKTNKKNRDLVLEWLIANEPTIGQLENNYNKKYKQNKNKKNDDSQLSLF